MTKKLLLKSASIIGSATLLSRLLGVIREAVMAHVFGTGWFAQAFFVAFRIPNMFRELVAEGASNAAFVPVFSQYRATKSQDEFSRLINATLAAVVIIVTVIVLIGIILSPLVVRLIAPGFAQTPEKLQLTIALNRPLFGYLFLISIAAFMMGVLHTFKSFLTPALSPVLFNASLIVSILLADNSERGIWTVVWGVIIAGALQIAIQVPALLKRGFRLTSSAFNSSIFRGPGVRHIGKLLVPRVIGAAVYQLNVLIDTMFASLSFFVGEGAIAAIYYATRLIQFPLGVFGHAISNASLPTLSEFAANNQAKKYADTVIFGLTNILFVMIPASFGFIVLSRPIIALIFQRGAFTSYSTEITAIALSFYAVGLAAFAANKFLALSFNALQDTKTPVKASAIALLLNIILNAFFVIILKTKIAGLAFASSLSTSIAAATLYIWLLRRVPDLDTAQLVRQATAMVVSAIAMAIATYSLWSYFMARFHPAINLGITILSAAAIYVFLGSFLKIKQAQHLTQWILKKR